MTKENFILREKEFLAFQAILKRLVAESFAKAVFLIDKNGSLLTSVGETAEYDATSLASLAAGNIAATGGLAGLIGEREFAVLFHEGEKDSMHLSLIENRIILIVIFDDRSSVGLVRLRVRKATEEMGAVVRGMGSGGGGEDVLDTIEELTDSDIENLFK
jgi:predicted regulator of Ras-like GTPase activity (Roadblock/LC7/MglB family)